MTDPDTVDLPVVPNLFIVGAAKSGTTALHGLLAQHPEICMSSAKEPHFFADVRPDRNMRHMVRVISEPEAYADLFDVRPGHRVIGEASPSYLPDAQAAKRIAAASPDAKIIILLRDPIERAHSHYLMDVREGIQDKPFLEALEEDARHTDRRWGTKSHLYVDLGQYDAQVARYLDAFPPGQVLVMESIQLKSDRAGALEQIARFLEVDPTGFAHVRDESPNEFTAPRVAPLATLTNNRHGRRFVRGALPQSAREVVKRAVLVEATKPPIDPETRAYLRARLEPDVEALRTRLHMPLDSLTSRWSDRIDPATASVPGRGMPLGRLGGFLGLPVLAAATPLLTIPSITHALGSQGWAALAIGQAVGAFAMVLIMLGWSVVGPAELPGLSPAERAARYRASIASRGLAALVVLPVGAALAASLVDGRSAGAAALTVVAIGLWGLGPNWFYIGTGKPSRIAVTDTLPKFAAALLTIVWLAISPDVYAFPIASLLASAGTCAAAAIAIGGTAGWSHTTGTIRHVRTYGPLVAGRVVASGFSTLSVPLVAFVNPAAVPVFAGLERFRGWAWMAVNAVSMAFQGWIHEVPSDVARRRRSAFRSTLFAGCVVGAAVAIGLPLFDRWIFSGKVTISAPVALTTGITIAVVAASISLTFHYLGPQGDTRAIFIAAIAGAVIGIPIILVGAESLGAQGANLGILAAEAAVVAVLARGVRRQPTTS